METKKYTVEWPVGQRRKKGEAKNFLEFSEK
jgi:hypothetical protein